VSKNVPVAIAGLGIEIPGISGIDVFLDALASPIEPVKFVPENKLERKGLRYKDCATKLALCAALAALNDAGLPVLPSEQLSPHTFGVIVSSNLCNLDTVCRVVETIRVSHVKDISSMDLPNASSNVVATSIAIRFGLQAINLMLCNGATSGIDALYLAANAIRAGRAQRMLVVGVEPTNPTVAKLMGESASARLGTSSGIRLGNIAGAVVLESTDAALERGASIYGYLQGYSYKLGIDIKNSILAAVNGDLTPPDIWLTPNRFYAPTAKSVEHTLELWQDKPPTSVLDLGVALGETYGALGVLQCITACLWLRTHQGTKAIATSGASWGDGSASLLIKAPKVIEDRTQRQNEMSDWSILQHQGHTYRHIERVLPKYTIHVYEPKRISSNFKASIAMLHGMEGKWDAWEYLFSHIDPEFQIFSLELPWAGQQNHRWGLNASVHEWVKLGLETIPTDISIIIAHSFGANAVLEYLNTYGVGQLKALVLISPFYKERYELFNWSLMTYYVNHFQKFLEKGLEVRQTSHLAPETINAMSQKVRDRIGPYGWLQFFNLLSRTPHLNLHSIHIPCLVIGGENDICSFPADCEALAKSLPCATLKILPNCDHFSMLEQPQTVLSLINRFLLTTLRG